MRRVVSCFVVVGAIAAGCGDADSGPPAEPGAASAPAVDTADAAPPSGDAPALPAEAPDACDLLDVAEWEGVTGLDLDAHPSPPGSQTVGSWCGITRAGEELPFLGSVQVNNGSSVELLESFIDSYPEMEVVEGIGDRALYSDESIMGSPSIAFTKAGVEVFVNLDTEGATRAQVEEIARLVASHI